MFLLRHKLSTEDLQKMSSESHSSVIYRKQCLIFSLTANPAPKNLTLVPGPPRSPFPPYYVLRCPSVENWRVNTLTENGLRKLTQRAADEKEEREEVGYWLETARRTEERVWYPLLHRNEEMRGEIRLIGRKCQTRSLMLNSMPLRYHIFLIFLRPSTLGGCRNI